MATGKTNIYGIMKGAWTPFPWEQPVLSSNGEWGVDELSVYCSDPNTIGADEIYEPWRAMDGKSNQYSIESWITEMDIAFPTYYYISTLNNIDIKSIKIKTRNRSDIICSIKEYKLYGSVDDITYEEISHGYNNVKNGEWEIKTTLSKFFKYFKLEIISPTEGNNRTYVGFSQATITATTTDPNYIPYTIRVLTDLGVKPAATYEERLIQMEQLGVI